MILQRPFILQDHWELDKDTGKIDLDDAAKAFGESLVPDLWSSINNQLNHWGQVEKMVNKKCVRKKNFYKVGLSFLEVEYGSGELLYEN